MTSHGGWEPSLMRFPVNHAIVTTTPPHATTTVLLIPILTAMNSGEEESATTANTIQVSLYWSHSLTMTLPVCFSSQLDNTVNHVPLGSTDQLE